jgi:hypothetical protein
MMEYKDLLKVNEKLNTLPVKGKNYVMVNERVKAFRELFPMGTISTTIEHLGDGMVVMRTIVSDGDLVLATGLAYEKETSSYINKTSYIENCETSAVGRALGFLGIGIDASMASAEELANAITQQNEMKDAEKTAKVRKQKIGKDKGEALMNLLEKAGQDSKDFLRVFKVEKPEDLTEEQHLYIVQELAKRGKDGNDRKN